MTDEGNNVQAPENQVEGQKGPDIDSKFQTIAEQLKNMNEQFLQSQQQLINAVKPQQQVQEAELDPYNPDSLKAYVSRIEQEAIKRAEASVQSALQKDTQLKSTIARLASDFPEINSDAATQQMVLEAHKSLPKNLQDTAEGYELAVARVAAKQGLVAKPKRQQASSDDYSASGYQPGRKSSSAKKVEVSETAKIWSQLLGRDTESAEYKKNMAEISQRKFRKYE